MSASKKSNRKRKHSDKIIENGKIRKTDQVSHNNVENGNDASDHEIAVDPDVEEEVEEELKTTGSFNMKKFREKLKSGDFIAELRHFLQEAATNSGLIAKYVNVGGKPLELIEALERIDKTQLFHVSYLFQITQLVLIEILSNSTQLTQAAVQSCSYLLNKHRSCIESLLNSRTSSHRKSVLKLLTAVVALEPTFGREILSAINVVFNPETLERFTHHTKPDTNGGGETVRTCYIHFVMAYLIEGNVMLVRNILDRNELIMAVLSGLVYDSQDTVSLVLGTLLKYVLKATHVSKTKKVQVFNVDIVTKLVALFEWKGPAYFAATLDKKDKANADSFVDKNDLELVSKVTYEFLNVLLCSRKHGIAFQCIGFRLLKKNNTQKVFLSATKQPWKNPYTAELAIEVLKACPELSKVALKRYNFFLDVKKKAEFFQTVDWFCKMLEGMTPNVLRTGAENMSASEMVQLIQTICMGPEILQKLAIDSRIRNSSIKIRYATTRLLHVMFKQCNNFLFAIGKWNVYSQHDMRKIKFDMINHIFVCSPTVQQILLSLHMTLMKPGEDDMFNHLESTLDLLLIIAKSIPSFIDASASVMNYMKILQPIYEMHRGHESSTRIELKAVQLILTLEPKALSVNTPLFNQVVDSFINVFIFGAEKEQNEAKLLLRNVFLNTGFFENGMLEIDLWLEALKFIDHEAVDGVKKFLVTALSTYNTNKVSKLASSQIDGVSNVKNIEELFFNIDNGLTLTGFMDIPTLSNFFVHAVAKLSEQKDELASGYITNIGFLLFHYQPEPESIQSLMKDMKHQFSKYMKNWLVNGKPGKLTEHDLATLVRFYEALLDGDKTFEDVFKSPSSGVRLRIGDVEVEVDRNLSTESRVMIFIYVTMFVVVQLNKQNGFDGKLNDHCTAYMKGLIEVLHQLWNSESKDTKGGFEVEQIDNSFTSSLKYIFESRFYFLDNFNIWHNTGVTKFIVDLTKYIGELNADYLDDILHHYRTKITNQIEQAVQATDKDSTFKPPSTSDDVLAILDVFSLKHDHLVTIIESVGKLPLNEFSTVSQMSRISLDILGFVVKRVASLKVKVLSSEHIKSICKIYIAAMSQTNDQPMNERFEDAVFSYLKVFYHSIGSVSDELFTAILKSGKPSKVAIKLASLLLERNKTFTESFVQLLPTLTTRKELLYPLLNVVANGSLKLDPSLLSSMYSEFKSGIMKTIEKPQKAGVIYKENIFSTLFLIEQCMPLNECIDFAKKSNKFDFG
ncbi:hypothetical protein HA402_008570 [Bradysia odoriphaga]|nr:hypothetical protein HA402_008570 [Bradysia odoriphaga]